MFSLIVASTHESLFLTLQFKDMLLLPNNQSLVVFEDFRNSLRDLI